MRLLLLLLALLLVPAPSAGQEKPAPSLGEIAREAAPGPAPERPPLSGERVTGQIFTGAFGGVVGAAAVGFGYYYAVERGTHEWAGLGAIVLGALVGYPAGAAAGVYLISSREEQTGSLLATLGGAAAGAVVGGVLAGPTQGLSYLALVPIGATAGFNLTRRWRDPPPTATR